MIKKISLFLNLIISFNLLHGAQDNVFNTPINIDSPEKISEAEKAKMLNFALKSVSNPATVIFFGDLDEESIQDIQKIIAEKRKIFELYLIQEKVKLTFPNLDETTNIQITNIEDLLKDNSGLKTVFDSLSVNQKNKLIADIKVSKFTPEDETIKQKYEKAKIEFEKNAINEPTLQTKAPILEPKATIVERKPSVPIESETLLTSLEKKFKSRITTILDLNKPDQAAELKKLKELAKASTKDFSNADNVAAFKAALFNFSKFDNQYIQNLSSEDLTFFKGLSLKLYKEKIQSLHEAVVLSLDTSRFQKLKSIFKPNPVVNDDTNTLLGYNKAALKKAQAAAQKAELVAAQAAKERAAAAAQKAKERAAAQKAAELAKQFQAEQQKQQARDKVTAQKQQQQREQQQREQQQREQQQREQQQRDREIER